LERWKAEYQDMSQQLFNKIKLFALYSVLVSQIAGCSETPSPKPKPDKSLPAKPLTAKNAKKEIFKKKVLQ